MRISDADRERVVEELGQHLTAGRLDIDAYAARVAEAMLAESLADLDHARRDLPFLRVPVPEGRRVLGGGVVRAQRPPGAGGGPWAARLVLLLSVVLVVAGAAVAIAFQVVWIGILVVGWLLGIAQGVALRSRR